VPNETLPTLSAGGLTMLVVSVGFVVSLAFWCYRRVLTAPKGHPNEPPAGLGP
jgi:hypothetical protein